jgi:hypothetical protein
VDRCTGSCLDRSKGDNAVPVFSGAAMKISMFEASVPTFVHSLNNLAAILEKGASYAAAKKIDPAVLAGSRLFVDMFALSRQVQIATDIARGGAARLAGVEPPAYEDKETDLAQLVQRVKTTVAYLQTLKPEQFEGSETKTVSWQTRSGSKSMQGLPYLLSHVIPNVYFHITTAYNILRHNGVELGKKDFLGNP